MDALAVDSDPRDHAGLWTDYLENAEVSALKCFVHMTRCSFYKYCQYFSLRQ